MKIMFTFTVGLIQPRTSLKVSLQHAAYLRITSSLFPGPEVRVLGDRNLLRAPLLRPSVSISHQEAGSGQSLLPDLGLMCLSGLTDGRGMWTLVSITAMRASLEGSIKIATDRQAALEGRVGEFPSGGEGKQPLC